MGVTSVQVFIPASGWDDGARQESRGWVSHWWSTRGYPTEVGYCDERPWRKGVAVNDLIMSADADVVIVADGDVFADERQVSRAVELAGRGEWVAPFSWVHRLSMESTAEVLACDSATYDRPKSPGLAQKPHSALPGGGLVVAPRELWQEAGGFDPRFTDWGGEDYSLGCVLRTLSGRAAKVLPGKLWHLWHPPQRNVRAETRDTSALAMRYRRAKFRPDDMRRLLAEWR